MINNNREETGSLLAGALATIVIYFVPALSTSPQPVQGAIQTVFTLLVVYLAGVLPKAA